MLPAPLLVALGLLLLAPARPSLSSASSRGADTDAPAHQTKEYRAMRDQRQRHSEEVMLLHDAVQQHAHRDVRDLINAGVDIHEATKTGATALHYAAQRGELAIVHELLLAGADPNRGRDDGETAVHLAVSGGNPELIPLLMEHGADANARAGGGETPLHYAAQHGDLAMVEALLSAGAAPQAENEVNQTAADYAGAETSAEHRATSAQAYHAAGLVAEEARKGIQSALRRAALSEL